ncbi:carbon-phosphorus lyase subunit PhnH [Tateyamaria omphalii]|uniref:phosphonate C-P lyase system protein PhnH n=1 Tax=Tateyamaria omphalii TaxID=299262 RepID=UPI00167A50A4|nr:phosphonate C-P lyase system protein PhnH [Tateyamaria omphalii]GGX43194.1 carbon-phosphorus lyase subunit PhnH [Tateyamaria omphalii]
MEASSLAGGFADPSQESARAFRGIMRAMSCPGSICDITGATPPAPLSVAAGSVLVTLCDHDTGVHLAGRTDTQVVRDWITFQTGAPLVEAEMAQFVLGCWEDLNLTVLATGSPEYPDRSATVIVEMPALEATGHTLVGPGIKDTAQLNLPDLAALQNNAALFPLGLDFMFTCSGQIAALPRTTKVS